MGDTALVIPLYNEESRLPKQWREIERAVARHNLNLVLVDDGSADNTKNIALKLLKGLPEGVAGELLQPGRGGKGSAVRAGMLHAFDTGCEHAFMCDVDLAVSLDEIPRFLETAKQGADVVIASRRAEGGEYAVAQPWWRHTLGWASSQLVSRVLDLGTKDTQCGFKLFHSKTREIFAIGRINGPGFDFELLRACLSQGFTFKELGVVWRDDGDSRFGIGSFRTALAELRQVRRLWKQGYYGG